MTGASRAFDFDAIKAGVSIVDVVAKLVPLKRGGKEYKGCCPFHGEKTPSFTVNEDKGFYHCFGCGAHGDVLDFVRETQSLSTAEAIKMLGAGDFTLDEPARQQIKACDAEREAERAKAILQARNRWEAATPAPPAHAYLVRKGIKPHHARLEVKNLLLPVYDRFGDVQSVQAIAPDGQKIFHPAAPMKGGRCNLGIAVGRSFICEGFATGASIYESTPERVCIAYTGNGVKDMARDFAAAGVDFAIAADRTGAPEMFALGAELGVPVFIPPEGFDDFNDLASAQGHDAVTKILRGAPLLAAPAAAKAAKPAPAAPANDVTAESTDPVDLWARAAPPPLPPGLLPPLLERFAVTRSRLIGGDAGGLAMSALAVCGALITDRITLKIKRHEEWAESARLWVMLIGEPSYKKSPLMRAAAHRISKMDAEMLRDHDRKLADWQRAKQDGEETEPPRERRLRIEDTTMEAAQEVCKNSPDGILALQDELSGWFGGIEKYAGGKGGAKDRSFWLRAYNGGEYAVNRISRKSVLIDNLSISILGGIQPDAIRKVVADASDDGLIQRFLPVVLSPAGVGVDEKMPDVTKEYDDLLCRLHELAPPSNFFGDVPLVFDSEAMEIRAQLEREHYDTQTSWEKINKKMATHFGKYDGIFPRLCIIWHCIENANAEKMPPEISGATAQRVATFLHSYIMRHAVAFYQGVIGLTEDQDIIEDIAGYILAHGVEIITPRTFQRGSTRMRKLTKFQIQPICEQLVALGWLDEISDRGERFSAKVNKRVHEVFAARTADERAQRQETVATIRRMTAGE